MKRLRAKSPGYDQLRSAYFSRIPVSHPLVQTQTQDKEKKRTEITRDSTLDIGARRKEMETRILKSGPTNAIKRANYPRREREREREREGEGSTRSRARILSTCLTRTLEAHSSHRECSHTKRRIRTLVAKFTCLPRTFFPGGEVGYS